MDKQSWYREIAQEKLQSVEGRLQNMRARLQYEDSEAREGLESTVREIEKRIQDGYRQLNELRFYRPDGWNRYRLNIEWLLAGIREKLLD